MPRRRRIGSHSSVERPSTRTSPALGSRRRLTSFKAVVFPEPLRPSKTRVSPRRTARENDFRIALSATRHPKSWAEETQLAPGGRDVSTATAVSGYRDTSIAVDGRGHFYFERLEPCETSRAKKQEYRDE